MTKLILVRHGQTTWNKELKYQGHSDTPLSEEGVRQAELVAERLRHEKVDAVYASDLNRALVTAEKIARRHNLPVGVAADLREIKFGKWEGMKYKAISEGWPDEMEKLYKNPSTVQIPEGETFAELKERAMRGVANILRRHPEQTVVVVSHGGTIRTILCAVLAIHLDHVWDIKQDNTAVNIIEYHGKRGIVALVNDANHLDKLDLA